jgi:hypothetical protein
MMEILLFSTYGVQGIDIEISTAGGVRQVLHNHCTAHKYREPSIPPVVIAGVPDFGVLKNTNIFLLGEV